MKRRKNNHMPCWSTRPTTVPAGSDHYFFTKIVRPSQNFKIKQQSPPAGSEGWPSGSLMTPVLYFYKLKAKNASVSSLTNRSAEKCCSARKKFSASRPQAKAELGTDGSSSLLAIAPRARTARVRFPAPGRQTVSGSLATSVTSATGEKTVYAGMCNYKPVNPFQGEIWGSRSPFK